MQLVKPGYAENYPSAEVIELLFRTFCRRFTSRWRDNYEDPKARELWRRDLKGLTDFHVKRGLHLSADLQWPPSPGEFRALCQPSPQDLGLPSLDQAFREACVGVTPQRTHSWSHAAVYQAALAAGRWELLNLPVNQSRPLFERAYAVLVRRVLNGEQLDTPIPRALPKSLPRRSPEVAAKEIGKLKQILSNRRAA